MNGVNVLIWCMSLGDLGDIVQSEYGETKYKPITAEHQLPFSQSLL